MPIGFSTRSNAKRTHHGNEHVRAVTRITLSGRRDTDNSVRLICRAPSGALVMEKKT
jgi:hypothetical protein